MKRLSLGNTNFVGEDFDNSILEDSKNKYCVVSLILFYNMNHVESDYTGKFFLHKCTVPEQAEREKVGNFKLADQEKPFGLSYFNKLAKELATFCGFTNSKK